MRAVFAVKKRRSFCHRAVEQQHFLFWGIDGFRLCTTAEKCNAPCTTEQFTCDNGCCLDPGLECDSTPQCSDSSDEQKCEDCKHWRCKLGLGFDLALRFQKDTSSLIWYLHSLVHPTSLACPLVNNTFDILLQIPVNEQKGEQCFAGRQKLMLSSLQSRNLCPLVVIFVVRCTELPDTGSCRDSLTKWYYNPVKQECSRFNYGGCQGNENRFDSQESCMKYCRGVTG